MKPKYPGISSNLIGSDGNAFSIVERVKKDLLSGGVSQEEVIQFQDDAMSGDYNHLLQVVLQWVNVGNGNGDDFFDEEELGCADVDEDDMETCSDCGDDFFNCVCDWDEDDGEYEDGD